MLRQRRRRGRRAGRPISDPPTSSSAKTTSRAKSCASPRPTSRCRLPCWSTTAPRRATTSCNIRRALPGFIDGADRRRAPPARQNEIALIGLGERPTILPTTPPTGASSTRRSTASVSSRRGAPATCSTASSRSARGSRSAAPSRPVIVAIMTERPGAQPTRITTRCSSRCATRARRCTSIALGPPASASTTTARSRDIVVEQGPAMTRRVHDGLLTELGPPGQARPAGRRADAPVPGDLRAPDSLIPPEQVTVSARRTGLTARGTLARPQGRRRRRP